MNELSHRYTIEKDKQETQEYIHKNDSIYMHLRNRQN